MIEVREALLPQEPHLSRHQPLSGWRYYSRWTFNSAPVIDHGEGVPIAGSAHEVAVFSALQSRRDKVTLSDWITKFIRCFLTG